MSSWTVSSPAAPVCVPVELGLRRYEVLIGRGLLASACERIAVLAPKARLVIVSEGTVAGHWQAPLQAALGPRCRGWVIVAPGERSKSYAGLSEVVEGLIGLGVERGDLVVAAGGGVIGDLAGFAAAILRRGVGFVQVPTSLLAMVDSSVGGKTGINSPHGKNLVGAFHQPRLVLADLDTLATLAAREMRAGYAEIAKYGLLGDASFFAWLEANGKAVLSREPAALTHAITTSVSAKAGIVARDETEQGERALLNLGHTFGHALEAATGFGDRVLHGEGVSIGMCLAFGFSEHLGVCPPGTRARISRHLAALGLPSRIADIPGDRPTTDRLLALMAQDKKVVGGALTFILARDVGEAFIARDVPADKVRAFLAGE